MIDARRDVGYCVRSDFHFGVKDYILRAAGHYQKSKSSKSEEFHNYYMHDVDLAVKDIDI